MPSATRRSLGSHRRRVLITERKGWWSQRRGHQPFCARQQIGADGLPTQRNLLQCFSSACPPLQAKMRCAPHGVLEPSSVFSRSHVSKVTQRGISTVARQRGSESEPKMVAQQSALQQEPAWLDFAACRGRSDLYFGLDGESVGTRVAREKAALAVCATCPARRACRDFARKYRQVGIWGGETDRQRRPRRRRAT
jgi:WhiB family transcriptional regulator, redox-sensing transcriptional regulator